MAEAKQLQVAEWQHTCPECGYENGFHVSFHRVAADREGRDTTVWLICPSCSARFDLGLRTRLAQSPKA